MEAKRRRERQSGFFSARIYCPSEPAASVRRGRARAATFLPAGRVSYLMFCPLRKGPSSGRCEWGPHVGYIPRVVKLGLGPCTTLWGHILASIVGRPRGTQLEAGCTSLTNLTYRFMFVGWAVLTFALDSELLDSHFNRL